MRMEASTASRAPSLIGGEVSRETARKSALHNFLTRDLKFPTLELDRSLNLDINVVWDYEDGADVNPAIAAALR